MRGDCEMGLKKTRGGRPGFELKEVIQTLLRDPWTSIWTSDFVVGGGLGEMCWMYDCGGIPLRLKNTGCGGSGLRWGGGREGFESGGFWRGGGFGAGLDWGVRGLTKKALPLLRVDTRN